MWRLSVVRYTATASPSHARTEGSLSRSLPIASVSATPESGGSGARLQGIRQQPHQEPLMLALASSSHLRQPTPSANLKSRHCQTPLPLRRVLH
jgi:hypothetical protein